MIKIVKWIVISLLSLIAGPFLVWTLFWWLGYPIDFITSIYLPIPEPNAITFILKILSFVVVMASFSVLNELWSILFEDKKNG